MKSLIATAQPSLYMSVICVCGRTAGKTISCESHLFPTSQPNPLTKQDKPHLDDAPTDAVG